MRNRRWMRWTPQLAALASVGMLSACITLVSDYDDVFDHQAAATQKEIDGFLQKLSDNSGAPAGSYDANIDEYGKIEVDLNSLMVRARSHDKNSDTIDQVNRVMNTVNGLKKLHHDEGHLNKTVDSIERRTINDEFTAMEKLELLKKRGKG